MIKRTCDKCGKSTRGNGFLAELRSMGKTDWEFITLDLCEDCGLSFNNMIAFWQHSKKQTNQTTPKKEMSAGSERDYHNGVKGNWRRTIHNRIVERLAVPPREAVVLYLAAKQDLDRAEFLRRGYRRDNLIIVERSTSVAGALRQQGKLVINGDFFPSVQTFGHRVDLVYGDFCGGLEKSVYAGLLGVLFQNKVHRAVFAFNFLRGRDGSGNGLRAFNGLFEKQTKSRATTLIRLVAYLPYHICRIDEGEHSAASQFNDYADTCCRGVLHQMAPFEATYKSAALTFDSCIFRNPFSLIEDPPLSDEENRTFLSSIRGRIDPKLRMSVTAIQAHRTMRLNGSIN